MSDTTAKKEKQKKKAMAKQEKAEKMKERQKNNNKGKSLEDMLAYVDENGNLSPTPPNPARKKSTNSNNIPQYATSQTEEKKDTIRKGVVTYFNEAKGYGFITDNATKENIFLHVNQLSQSIKEKDVVTFKAERNAKGLAAVNVSKTSS